MDTRTEEITDKQRIRELQNHYSYSIDFGKYDNLDVMFTHNATYNFVTGSTDNIETLKFEALLGLPHLEGRLSEHTCNLRARSVLGASLVFG